VAFAAIKQDAPFRRPSQACAVGITITHNGDFEGYELFGSRVSNQVVGRWLERVLHCSNSVAGDSPKIAGILELLATQGRWGASVRLAYQIHIAKSLGDAASGDAMVKPGSPNTAPQWAWCVEVGQRFESHISRLLDASDARQKLEEAVTESIISEISAREGTWQTDYEVRRWDADEVSAFTSEVVGRFLRGNLFSAMKEFMRKAHGSFGIQAYPLVSSPTL